MKRISFLLTLSLLILSFGLANAAQEVTIDGITGSYEDGGTNLIDGANVTFHLRVTNTDSPGCKYAPAMSFAVTSADGATWTSISLSQEILWVDVILAGVLEDTIYFDNLFSQTFVEYFSNDGALGDTVGFSGVAFAADSALFYGLDAVVFNLEIGPITGNGGTICLDWGGARNDGFDWGWNALDNETGGCDGLAVSNNFVGAACYGVGTPPDFAPVFDVTTTTIEGSHCEVLSFDFDASDPDPGAGPGPDDITYSADIGTVDPNTGAWSYTGALADVGSAITLNLTATEADNPVTTTEVVNIVLTNAAPEFTDGCGAELFAQTTVQKDHSMAGLDDCPGDPMTMSVVSISPAGFTGSAVFNGTTLEIIAAAGDEANSPYTFTLGISDGVDDGANCDIIVNVSAGALYVIEIEKTHGTIQGSFANVAITATSTPGDMGGFNLLVSYDASALTFQGATPGTILDQCGWEYFTYRYGADGNCNGGCPSGLVRLVGIAETNNGANHPVADCAFDDGTLANLSFLVSNDRTLECQYVPIRFFWIDCGDNTISNEAGTLLYIAATVKEYPGDGASLMATYPSATLPTFVGPMGCAVEDKAEVQSDIDFLNGGIDIVCADSIDDRADINLDGLAYTIADAVMYSNYFVDGLTALVFVSDINQYGYVPGYAGSIAASDVNADGLALTVADLVYLIRVVVGDAQPYDKVTPMAANLTVGNSLTVDAPMGGALVVLAGDQTPELMATNMEMKSSFDGENTRVLVWSQTGETFEGEFLSNVGNVISTELATADGAMVVAKPIPESFKLGQNYPNPFNPTTEIALSLPTASDYSLVIYNVTGQVVETINGSADAGFVTVEWDASANASGVYFYKLTAGNFSDTKKMVLLK